MLELTTSLAKIGFGFPMSVMTPSTRWPPFTTFCVLVVVGPPPQAASSSMPPAMKAEKATAPPIPRRKSRRDHSSRNRSNWLSSPSALLLLPTSLPPSGSAISGRLAGIIDRPDPIVKVPIGWAIEPLDRRLPNSPPSFCRLGRRLGARPQGRHLLRAVADHLRQHLLGVLAQQGRRQPDGRRQAVQLPRRSDLPDAAGGRVLHLDAHLA